MIILKTNHSIISRTHRNKIRGRVISTDASLSGHAAFDSTSRDRLVTKAFVDAPSRTMQIIRIIQTLPPKSSSFLYSPQFY